MNNLNYIFSLKKIPKYLICLSLLLILNGCARYRVVDQINIVDIMGFEEGKDSSENKLYGGVMIYEYSRGKEDPTLKSIMSHGKSATQTLTQINRKSPHLLEIGKTRVIVLGVEYAKEQGIYEVVNSICRNAKIGGNLKVVLSEEPVSKLFDKLTQEKGDFLHNLLEQNMIHHFLPYSNLQSFLYNFYGFGIDAHMPYVSFSNEGDIIVNKIGVIGDDSKLKIVLEEDYSFILKLFNDRSMEFFFSVPINKDGKEGTITLKSLRGNIRKDIKTSNNDNEISVALDLETIILDYPKWIDIPSDYSVLEKQTQSYLDKNFRELFDSLKEKKVDPLGIGDIFRSKERNWEKETFYEEIYPNLKLKTDLNIKILQSGVGEDSL